MTSKFTLLLIIFRYFTKFCSHLFRFFTKNLSKFYYEIEAIYYTTNPTLFQILLPTQFNQSIFYIEKSRKYYQKLYETVAVSRKKLSPVESVNILIECFFQDEDLNFNLTKDFFNQMLDQVYL